MISTLISAYRNAVRSASNLWRGLVAAFTRKEFAKIAVEFFAEAAVLVFVFPVLDTIIETGGLQRLTWALFIWSTGLAVFFLFLAGIISMRIGD